MEISQKIAELEAEKAKIDQKISLLRELEGEVTGVIPTLPPKPKVSEESEARREEARQLEKNVKVLSTRKIGNKVITEEWIGAKGSCDPKDYNDEAMK